MKTSDGVQASRVGELRVERYFTRPGVDPLDEVEWEIRDARIGYGDKVAFELIEDRVSGPRATAVRLGNRARA